MRVFINGLFFVLFLAAGVGVAVFLVKTKPKAKKTPPPEEIAYVEAQDANQDEAPVVVTALGQVEPAHVVVLQPEVSGRVVSLNPALVVGGRMEAGDELLTIDDRDYKLAVQAQTSAVAQAKTNLALEAGRRAVAEREWEIMKRQGHADEASRDLALRVPQRQAAKAALASARAALGRAKLARSKTKLTAPFNALVRDESVEPGQLVGPASRVATLVDSDVFWVQVAVPTEELRWLAIPGLNARPGAGAAATVIHEPSGVVRRGRVVRLLGDLDQLGKMARLIVAVEHPLDPPPPSAGPAREGSAASPLPLLLGSTVRVELQGAPLRDVVTLPRKALRDNGEVWLMGSDGRLVQTKVQVARRGEDHVYVRGLPAGARIITSPVPGAVPGLKLALEGTEGQPRAAAQGGDAPAEDESPRPHKASGQEPAASSGASARAGGESAARAEARR